MARCIAFFLALVFASLALSSACVAADPHGIRFTLDSKRGDTEIEARFRDDDRRDAANWSSGFPPSKLIGLNVVGFYSAGLRPLNFAIVRDAGRLDCTGQGGSSHAWGNCAFTADPAFAQLLVSRGIGRATRDQAFGLMALDAKRALVDALAAARYPAPTIDQLMALTALGASGGFIDGLARVGYRPTSIQSLIEFKALNISAEYIGGLARVGYAQVPAGDLVSMKALNVTPEFIAGFARAGYRNLPVDKLIQLKALNITPQEVRAAEQQPGVVPPTAELMRRRR
jgi:hypothetical protein